MKDGDQCPECQCGTMMRHTSYMDVLRCTWCGHQTYDEDGIVRPKATTDAKQARL